MPRHKKTNKQFKKEVYGLVGNEYTFLDIYVNADTKIKVKHNDCGHVYKVTPSNFLRGSRCPYCRGNLKKTDDQFKKEVFDLVDNEYTFLDTYVNNYTKLRVKHNKCGNTYEVTPSAFLSGNRCTYCFRNLKKTDAQFKKEVYDLVGDEYTFLDTYVNNNIKLRVKHNKCGNFYKVKPNAFLSGNRCPYCYGKIKKIDAQFKKEVYNLVGNEYSFIESYVNNRTKIKVKHNVCGNIYKVTPSSFLQGSRCPYCFKDSKRKTNARFKQEISNLVGNEYIFLDSYVNAYTKIRVKHTKCNAIYEVRPSDFLSNNTRCPYCNISHGEDLITKILKSLGINYEYQKTFDDLKDSQPLSYDFYIPDQNILIEYQGIQHYESIDYFGGNATFKLQQKHDHMKADYAKSHNYNLITIPYTKDTFSKIKKYLLKHGLTA